MLRKVAVEEKPDESEPSIIDKEQEPSEKE
jgi:hypothetical protein